MTQPLQKDFFIFHRHFSPKSWGIIKIIWDLFLSLHWSWSVTPEHKEGCIQQHFRFSPGSDLIVRCHYLIGTFVPFSHNVLSSYISLQEAYLPFFCPLIWPSYFLFQFILIASVCHYTESSAENFILAGIFLFITMLSKIDPALIPGFYTFPYIKVIFPSIPPFFFPCIFIKYYFMLETSNAQDTSGNQTDKNLDSLRAYLLVWKDSL